MFRLRNVFLHMNEDQKNQIKIKKIIFNFHKLTTIPGYRLSCRRNKTQGSKTTDKV